jgi:NAD(P)H-hydrate repair Nnr-like enzyme with NAD(P)H-hydrate dehydratase domain
MTLNQLICRAASVYPDAYVLEYWNPEKSQPKANPEGGDTLAEFVACELADTYDEESSDSEQIATAVRVMQSAADDLAAVAHALSDLAVQTAERKAA